MINQIALLIAYVTTVTVVYCSNLGNSDSSSLEDDNSSFYCCLFGLYLSCLCGIITNQYWKEIINQGLNQ